MLPMRVNFAKYKLIAAILIVGILSCFHNEAHAAKNVKVATIGVRTPVLDKSMGYQRMVDRMIQFWKREIAHVLPDKPDLIILQENCDFPWGLSQDEKNAYIEVRKNQIQDFFASVAREHQCYLLFGTRRVSDGVLRNSGILIDRSGNIAGIYDKNYPTIGEMEAGIVPSNDVPIFQTDFGKVAIAICFDLNYDDHLKRYIELDPDIVLFPSAYHGGFVQSIWAYSCRSYFAGAISSVGRNSEILNPLGEIIASSTNYVNYAITNINLDYKLVHLDYNRSRLAKLKQKYGRNVHIHDPGGLGVVMVSSNHDNVPVVQMLEEFEVEILDDYFDRSIDARAKEL